MLTIANANLLAKFGSERADRDASSKPMLAGRFTGTMALSETQAGSSLADILTRAEPQDDGTYRLFGSKMWISGAEHELTENIVNLVLAKIPGGPPGTKGISLFIVPKYLVERRRFRRRAQRRRAGRAQPQDGPARHHQHRAELRRGQVHTPGGEAGAVGYLVGEPHRGLVYMFHMMNEARLGVGMGAVVARLHRLPEVAASTRASGRRAGRCRRRTRRPRRCRSSSTPTSSECCWRRRPMSKVRWRWCCTAPGSIDLQHSAGVGRGGRA